MASNFGAFVNLRQVLVHGRDVTLRAVVTGTNAATLTLAGAIGATGIMQVRNETGQYIQVLGYRIYDTQENQFPFYVYIECDNERQWTQSFSTGAGIHSQFIGVNGPFATPTWWKDNAGPTRWNRVWGMRGLAPDEILLLNFLNLTADQPVIRAEFLCRTMPANIKGEVGTDYATVLARNNEWTDTYQTMQQTGVNGDYPLWKTGGLYKHYPLFATNMPSANTNRAAATFGSLAVAANGELQVALPFPQTKEGLVVLHSIFGLSTGDFEYEFQGGGYGAVRGGLKSVSAIANLQGAAGRTNNNFYTEALEMVPRPYNVQQPPTILLRDVSGAPNNIRMAFGCVSIPRDIWVAGAGAK